MSRHCETCDKEVNLDNPQLIKKTSTVKKKGFSSASYSFSSFYYCSKNCVPSCEPQPRIKTIVGEVLL